MGKRRETQEAFQRDIAKLEASHKEKDGLLDDLKQQLEEMPLMISVSREKVAALEAKTAEKDGHLETISEQVQQSLPELQLRLAEVEAQLTVLQKRIASQEAKTVGCLDMLRARA